MSGRERHPFEPRLSLIAIDKAFRTPSIGNIEINQRQINVKAGIKQIGLEFINAKARLQEIFHPKPYFPNRIEQFVDPLTKEIHLHWNRDELSITRHYKKAVAEARRSGDKARESQYESELKLWIKVEPLVLKLNNNEAVTFFSPKSDNPQDGVSLGQIKKVEGTFILENRILPFSTEEQIERFLDNIQSQQQMVFKGDPEGNMSDLLFWAAKGKPIDFHNELQHYIDSAILPSGISYPPINNSNHFAAGSVGIFYVGNDKPTEYSTENTNKKASITAASAELVTLPFFVTATTLKTQSVISTKFSGTETAVSNVVLFQAAAEERRCFEIPPVTTSETTDEKSAAGIQAEEKIIVTNTESVPAAKAPRVDMSLRNINNEIPEITENMNTADFPLEECFVSTKPAAEDKKEEAATPISSSLTQPTAIINSTNTIIRNIEYEDPIRIDSSKDRATIIPEIKPQTEIVVWSTDNQKKEQTSFSKAIVSRTENKTEAAPLVPIRHKLVMDLYIVLFRKRAVAQFITAVGYFDLFFQTPTFIPVINNSGKNGLIKSERSLYKDEKSLVSDTVVKTKSHRKQNLALLKLFLLIRLKLQMMLIYAPNMIETFIRHDRILCFVSDPDKFLLTRKTI